MFVVVVIVVVVVVVVVVLKLCVGKNEVKKFIDFTLRHTCRSGLSNCFCLFVCLFTSWLTKLLLKLK